MFTNFAVSFVCVNLTTANSYFTSESINKKNKLVNNKVTQIGPDTGNSDTFTYNKHYPA